MEEKYDLAKWLAGEMSGAELEAFEKSPEYATYAKIKEHSSQLQAPEFSEKVIYDNVVSQGQKEKKVIPLYKIALRVAAIVVLAAGLFFFGRDIMPTTEIAENGQQTKFTLPDQSQVVLNAGSQVRYQKWGWENDRNLELSGQAFFKVAKGQKFEVSTSLGTVTVLGTQFDVKSRKDRFDVTCYEGRVRVEYGDLKTEITKGQSVAFAYGESIEVPQTTDAAPQWLSNEIVFTKETLAAIIAELDRQYNVTIELKTKASEQLFTGVLPMKNLDEALQIVCATYHLTSKKLQDKIILEVH